MISVGTRLKVADNAGAKELQTIKILGGSKRRHASLGDIVTASVKIATPRGIVKKKDVVRAVVVRTRKEKKREDGSTVRFDDNAAVILNDKGEATGSVIKGPVAREAIERFPTVGKIASIVV